jgi:hypothetical protein
MTGVRSPTETEAGFCSFSFSLAGRRKAGFKPANQVRIIEKNKMHFSELDGIRGLLCLIVLFYHWGLNTLLERLTSGYLGAGRWELAVDLKRNDPIDRWGRLRGNVMALGNIHFCCTNPQKIMSF